MQKITPFLMFNDQAEEAMDFYVSIFKDSQAGQVRRQGKDGPVTSAEFVLEGQPFMAFNGGPTFKFTEAISLFVSCENQAEVDELWDKLLADGGQPSQCGWLKDRFGVSWQIIPTALGKMLGDPDRAKANRALQAMLKMHKIDIAGLQKAYDQD